MQVCDSVLSLQIKQFIMTSQNFKNHSRYIPLWHFIVPLILLALLIGSIVNLVNASEEAFYSAALLVVIAAILPIFYWYTRYFALRAQDRAIRAEENLRHYILTGKPLNKELRMGQIIALRFASDEEFPILAKKALEEKMGQKRIKASIASWKADHHRV
jgi:hypothetical protein